MPNRRWNDQNAKDSTEFSEGKMGKGKDIGDNDHGGRLAPMNPTFNSSEYTSKGSEDMKSGMTPPKKK